MSLGTFARRSGLYDLLEPLHSRRQVAAWEKADRPIPSPSSVKRELLLEYARRYHLRVLIETGTFKGDTVRALRNHFDVIHSIELDDTLFEAAGRRCARQTNAHLHHGDSAKILPKIIAGLDGPALLWLDAHYSGAGTGGEGGSPILTEVRRGLDAKRGHVLLVDDVREFGATADYPELDAVRDLAQASGYGFEVRDDVARMVPKLSLVPVS